MNKRIGFGLVVALAAASACSGTKGSQTGAETPGETGGAQQVRVDVSDTSWEKGFLRLAHYSTGDGQVGLVIDQSSEPPRLKLDGSDEIVQLTAREAGNATFMKDPQGLIRLEIDRYGGVLLIGEHWPKRLYLDGEANKLGKPTNAGVAPPEKKHPSELALQRLSERSVMTRMKGFVNNDSGNLAKVTQAFGKVTPDMYVHVATTIERDVFRPAPRKIGMTDHAGSNGNWPADEAFDAKAKGLRGHGGVVLGEADDDSRGNWLRVHRPDGYPGVLAENTPGIVWEVDSSTVVFLTLDGGRYQLQWEDVALGLPPSKQWPKAPQHELLTDTDVEYLVKGGSMSKARQDDLSKIQDEFHACTVDGWKDFERTLKKTIVADKLSGTAAWAKADLMHEERTETVQKGCAKHSAAFDAALTRLIDGRRSEREALARKTRPKAEASLRKVARR